MLEKFDPSEDSEIFDTLLESLGEYAEKHLKYLVREKIYSDVEAEHDRADQDLAFFQINGVKVHDHLDIEKMHEYIQVTMRIFLTSLSGIGTPIYFLILGKDYKVKIYIGIRESKSSNKMSSEIVQSSLDGAYPGISHLPVSEEELDSIRDHIKSSQCSFMTGVPLVFKDHKRQIYYPEIILRGMYGQEFGYLVVADPVTEDNISAVEKEIYREVDRFKEQTSTTSSTSEYSSLTKSINAGLTLSKALSLNFGQNLSVTTGWTYPYALTLTGGGSSGQGISSSAGIFVGTGVSHGTGQSDSITENHQSRSVDQYIGKLELLLGRIQEGYNQGLWNTNTYLFSQDYSSLKKLESLIKGAFSTEFTSFEPFHFNQLSGVAKAASNFSLLTSSQAKSGNPLHQKLYPHSYCNPLTSSELSVIFNFPNEDLPGFKIKKVPKFSVNPKPVTNKSIRVGVVCDREKPLQSIPYCIERKELCKHTLITGVTGSGKTNTAFQILTGLENVPFLVVEPSKMEYRELRNHASLKNKIRIYTPGKPQISPLSINPFEIAEGESLQVHIEGLKAVLNASFPMWGPLPYIVENCLYRVYENFGWDVVYSTNKNSTLFPDLSDFTHEIEEYVAESSYSQEIKDNILGALVTRLKSLSVGSKGILFSNRSSMSMEELLSQPTVIELKDIADDEDKIFVMGLLFIKLYNYIDSANVSNDAFLNNDLKNFILIEEAHRLFQNVSVSHSQESADVRGNSVKYFENIVSEFRAYGIGVAIVDQIPSKIATGAIKNTNLKIVHRLTSQDDLEMMGQSCCLNESETSYLASLNTGRAIVHASDMDKPCNLQIDECKSSCKVENGLISDNSDESVKQHMFPFGNAAPPLQNRFLLGKIYKNNEEKIQTTAGKHLRAISFCSLDKNNRSLDICRDRVRNALADDFETSKLNISDEGINEIIRMGVSDIVKSTIYLRDDYLLSRQMLLFIEKIFAGNGDEAAALQKIQKLVFDIGIKHRDKIRVDIIGNNLKQRITPFIPEAWMVVKTVLKHKTSNMTFNPTSQSLGKLFNIIEDCVRESFLIDDLEVDNHEYFSWAILLCKLNYMPKDRALNVIEKFKTDILKR